MENIIKQHNNNQVNQVISWNHFLLIVAVVVLLGGATYLKKPEIFSLKKVASTQDNTNVPHYYSYVTPEEDMPKAAVLGANTNDGPSIISDDGEVKQITAEQVLGAATQGVSLALDSIKVNQVPDSNDAIVKYFSESSQIETGAVNSTDFAAALNSGNQSEIDLQAKKIIEVRDELQKIQVPTSLAKLQKLKIIQYNSSIELLKNFTLGDKNPDLIVQNTEQFLKSQNDLDAEKQSVAQKYPDFSTSFILPTN